MQRILIIGATSAIAESVSRLYAQQGARLFLLGRDAARLNAITEDLLVRGASAATYGLLDVNDLASHTPALDGAWAALSNVDVVLVAHGTLPNQNACETNAQLAMKEFSTNGTSTLALLIEIAHRMQPAKKGTIAVISSVAGDRGRASNYLYGAAKAAVSTYLSGLRQRMYKHGISVITIKPGFVDTPMTRDFKKGLLWAKPEDVAAGIVKSVERGRSVVYLPGFWRFIMTVIRLIPEFIFKRLSL